MINVQKYRLEVVKEEGARYDLDRRVTCPSDMYDIFRKVFRLDKQAEEVFCIVTLDIKNNLTGCFEVSRGTVSSANVTPREVFKRAILQNASAIILAHNHPSGDVNPSRDDINITRKLINVGEMLGIDVLDHVIIGDMLNHSMKEEGEI